MLALGRPEFAEDDGIRDPGGGIRLCGRTDGTLLLRVPLYC